MASIDLLKSVLKGKRTLILMYTYDLMTPLEKKLIVGAQCPVIVWGSKLPPFRNTSHGVSTNYKAMLPWLTDELKMQPEFPFSENFSMIGNHYYLDDGDGLRSLLKAGLYKKGIPVHKDFEPVAPLEVPLLVNKEGEKHKGVMVVQNFLTLLKVVHNGPYFLPAGRRIDRVLTVSRPMRTYQRFHVYHFRSPSTFEREISSPFFVPVYKSSKEVAGFFKDVGEGVGITVTESTLGATDVWARATPVGFIVETRRKVYNFSIGHSSFEETFLDMSSAERGSLVSVLANSPSCRLLYEAWKKRLED
jgi:hypothetical protein